jgi:hypothetical protein
MRPRIRSYLGEYEALCKTASARESGSMVRLFDEKNRGSKISWHCPFKATLIQDFRPLVFLSNNPRPLKQSLFEDSFEFANLCLAVSKYRCDKKTILSKPPYFSCESYWYSVQKCLPMSVFSWSFAKLFDKVCYTAVKLALLCNRLCQISSRIRSFIQKSFNRVSGAQQGKLFDEKKTEVKNLLSGFL